MSDIKEKHWGRWVEARADALGYRSKVNLMERIKCSRQQLDRWLKQKSPPTKMRKGLDSGLCRALEVDHHTLFTTWDQHDPSDLPRVKTGVVMEPSASSPMDLKVLRKMITSLLDLANEETLMEIGQKLTDLIDKQNSDPGGDEKTVPPSE